MGEDVRHRFVLAGLVHIPGGFELSTVTQMESARPFTITTADNSHRVSVSFNNGAPVETSLDEFRGTPYIQADLRVTRPIKINERWRVDPFIEFFNLFNRNNPGANFAANVAQLPVQTDVNGVITGVCNPSCVPLTSVKQLEIPEGGLGDFFGPGTTVGTPFYGADRRASDVLAPLGFLAVATRAMPCRSFLIATSSQVESSPNTRSPSQCIGIPIRRPLVGARRSQAFNRNLAYSTLLWGDLSGPQKSSQRALSQSYTCSMASHQRRLTAVLLAFSGWSFSFLNFRSAWIKARTASSSRFFFQSLHFFRLRRDVVSDKFVKHLHQFPSLSDLLIGFLL